MQLVRMIYVSQNNLEPGEGNLWAQLNEILAEANRWNEKVNLTGALLFDKDWFAQSIEGRMTVVLELFERLRRDRRHSHVHLVEMKAVHSRLFGDWWMGCSELSERNLDFYRPYLVDGRFRPMAMSGEQILSLMLDLSRAGLHTRLDA